MKQLKQFNISAGQSPLDFSMLNDAPAGRHGFLKATTDGHLAFEDGTKVRFFGVNVTYTDALCDRKMALRTAEDLYRSGCNMVRLHHVDGNFPIGLIDYSNDNSEKISEEAFDKLDYLIYLLEERGIYIHIDLCTRRTYLEGDGFLAEEINQLVHPIRSVQYYDERIIKLNKIFMRQYLHHYNPYTKKRYVDDPGVAVVQLLNENSIYWDHKPTASRLFYQQLDVRFNSWLIQKYGTRTALDEAWTKEDGTKGLKADEDPIKGTVRRPEIGHWGEMRVDWRINYTSISGSARHVDHMEFLGDTQQRTTDMLRDYLKELGVKCVINYSNEHNGPADLRQIALGDITEYTCYWNHPSENQQPARIFTGEMCKPNMAWNNPDLPEYNAAYLAKGKVANKPYIVSEWCCCHPTKFRADSLLQMASYGALQGWDGFLLFTYSHPGNSSEGIRDFFDFRNDPAIWCYFGTAATIFRRGLVREADRNFEVAFSDSDWKIAPHDYGELQHNAMFVSKVAARFLNDHTYKGDADVVFASGHTASGDYTKAKHAIIHSVMPYEDGYLKHKKDDSWKQMHIDQDVQELNMGDLSIQIGSKSCCVDVPEGSGLLAQQSKELIQTIMKHWDLIDPRYGWHKEKVISDTGEIIFSYGRGVVYVIATQIRIIAGYLEATEVIQGLQLKLENKKASISVLSLDGKPVEQSGHLLVTAMGECCNTDERYGENSTILSRGHGPVLYDDVRGELQIVCNGKQIFALESDGQRKHNIESKQLNGGVLSFEVNNHIQYEILG